MRKFLILLALLSLGGCITIPDFDSEEHIMGSCSDAGDHFNIGRFEFDIYLDKHWEYSYTPETQDVTFSYEGQDFGIAGINVFSYHYMLFDLEGYWDDVNYIYERFRDDYVNHKSRMLKANPSYQISIVEKAGLQCVREWQIDYGPGNPQPIANANIGARDETLEYMCVVPGQTDRRPVDILITQWVPRGRKAFDLEKILEPVFASLKLNPNPPPVPNTDDYRPMRPPTWWERHFGPTQIKCLGDEYISIYACVYDHYLRNLAERARREASGNPYPLKGTPFERCTFMGPDRVARPCEEKTE
ncbi:hypothetical protein EDC39_11574 [Geothermobacter ehrlichii]|uniref:Uncharacterized protein n=1 Tax=Geothermobacter ehrlichii TaxID=213224 RepID=A0A5D3WGU1_9BACT|nr:hypothetical protein [Geothermobacter ehrlichii]TYO96127.1 hypothetical protein EDC39_11574 [Geothermobacter ehrlichii]